MAFTGDYATILASDNIQVTWKFAVADKDGNIIYISNQDFPGTLPAETKFLSTETKFLSTETKFIGEIDVDYVFRIDNFSGINLKRNNSELGIQTADTLNFDIINSDSALTASNYIGGSVTLQLVLGTSAIEPLTFYTWKFYIELANETPSKLIKIKAVDIVQQKIKEVWPSTPLISDLVAEGANRGNIEAWVPVPIGKPYIPLTPVYHAGITSTLYLLGPATVNGNAVTYTVYAARSPKEVGKVEYTEFFNQTTIGDYRYFYLTPTSGGTTAANLLFRNGDRLYDLPVQFSRSDTASLTNPADAIQFILEDMGLTVDSTTFATAKALYTTRTLAWNRAWRFKTATKNILAELQNSCASALRSQETVELIPFDATSLETVSNDNVFLSGDFTSEDTFSLRNVQNNSTNDSGYVAAQQADIPQDELVKVIVPAGGATTDNPTSDTLELYAVQDSQDVQKLGIMYFQKKLDKENELSFDGFPELLSYLPDQILTIGTDYDKAVYNLCKKGYSAWTDDDILSYTVAPVRGTVVLDTSEKVFGTQSLKMTATANNSYIFLTDSPSNYNMDITGNKKWIISGYVMSTDTNGECYLNLKTPSAQYTSGNKFIALPNVWTRISAVLDLTADSSTECFFVPVNNDSGNIMWFDGLMLEEQIDGATTPSQYVMPEATGQSPKVIIESLNISSDLKLAYKCIQFSHELQGWDDITVSGYTVSEEQNQTFYTPVCGSDVEFTTAYPLKNINYEIYDSEVLRTDEDVATNGGVEISNYGIKAYNTDPLLVFDLNISAGTLDLIANLNVKSGNDVTIDGGELTLWNTAHTTQYIDISGTGIEVLEGGDITMESVTGGTTLADRASIFFPITGSNVININSDYDGETVSIYPNAIGDTQFNVGFDFGGVASMFNKIWMRANDIISIYGQSQDSVFTASLTHKIEAARATTGLIAHYLDGGNEEFAYISLRATTTTAYIKQTAADGDPGSSIVNLNGDSVIYVSGANVYLRYKDYSGTARNIQLG
ncbi:MAG: hypothetical protein GY865_08215 [candidate division Zixibacteria bacterium]|nr:hypothetical protein [candidate division Zixibacteria bacterium]